MPNYYELLGIPPNAPVSDIEAAYRMYRRHAEWRGDADPALLAQYDAAWRTLSDPASRHAYDQAIGLGRPAPSGPADPGATADRPWAGQQGPQDSYQHAPRRTDTVAARPPGRGECRFCGSAPAARGRFRAHQGMIVLMRFRHLDGPFCRDCGVAVFREMTGKTLLQGWWGLASFFITMWIVAKNAILRRRFASLAVPLRDPAVQAPNARPFDPGKPLLRRAAALGLLVPLVVVGIAIASVNGDRPAAQVGKCVRISSDQAELVDCAQKHDGRVISIADNLDLCPKEADGALQRDDDDGKVLCVARGR